MGAADAVGAVLGYLLVIAGMALVASPGWACIVAGVLMLGFACWPLRTRPHHQKGESNQ